MANGDSQPWQEKVQAATSGFLRSNSNLKINILSLYLIYRFLSITLNGFIGGEFLYISIPIPKK
jgi:hypothetical protein